MGYKTVVQMATVFAESIRKSKLKEQFITALKHQDWDAVRNLRADPHAYTLDEVQHFRNDAQLTSFLRKLDCLPGVSPELRRERAVETFLEGEKRNAKTNNYLHRVLRYPVDMSSFDLEVRERAFLARTWIKRVLGPIPDYLEGRFGPGNVAEVDSWPSHGPLSAYNKMVYPPTYTGNFSPLARKLLCEDTAWGRAQLWSRSFAPVGRQVQGARSTTVPKDGTIDRFIGIEPGMNVFAQLAVGSYFKTRLNKIGIRMKPGNGRRGAPHGRRWLDGQEFHKLLAKEGSETGHWVTLDLSNASNHNAKEAIRFLFSDWTELLDELRSPSIHVNGRWHRLEMFSAMGNGFTFEVLTLVMLALAHASGFIPGLDAFAYGDDVILANDYRVQNFVALLEVFGHQVNVKKSFITGHFRESCGGDYMGGHDVRPVIVDEVPRGPLEWMEMYNLLKRKGLLPVNLAKLILRQVPSEWKRFGPEGIVGVFHSSRGWTFPRKGHRKDRHGWDLSDRCQSDVIQVVEYRTPTARLFPAAREPQLLMLLGAMGLPLDEVDVRGSGTPKLAWRSLGGQNDLPDDGRGKWLTWANMLYSIA